MWMKHRWKSSTSPRIWRTAAKSFCPITRGKTNLFTNTLSAGNSREGGGMKAKKFTFGTSFDAPAQPKKAPPVTFSEQQLRDAEDAAFLRGKEAGYAQAMAD